MLTDLKDRVLHWKTTTAGIAVTAVLAYLFTSLHCQVPSDWLTWAATAAPAILGILAKE